MKSAKHLEGLPVHEGNNMVSLLFMVNSKKVSVQDQRIELSRDANGTLIA